MNLEEYKKIFLSHLNKKVQLREPQNLYMPIKYILDLGGKRLRPILTLMACDLFGAESNKALDAASHEIENKLLKNIHSILSQNQREKFIHYFDDWEVK